MFVHEKKPYYTIKEAYEKTGYKPGTIQDYITKGYIEGERISGSWALTETGMKQLEIRKNRIEKELKEPAPIKTGIKPAIQPKPEPVKEPEKKPEPKPEVIRKDGHSLHFRTDADVELYSNISELAKLKGQSVHEYCMNMLRNSIKGKLSTLEKIRALSEQI